MPDIYNYIPQTNQVSRVYSVAPVTYLQFVLYVMFFHMLNVLNLYITIFRNTRAVPKVAVFVVPCSCFPSIMLRYYPNDTQMVPVSHIIIIINTTHVGGKNKGDTSNNRSDWDHFKIIHKIRGSFRN